jgi:hypothetical protein
MQIRTESQSHPLVSSPAVTIDRFGQDTLACTDDWAQRLQDNPDAFAEVEQEIDAHYRQGGGQLVASLLAEISQGPQMDEHVQQVRKDAAIPLRAPEPRTLRVRLLCGLMLWIATIYCAPRRGKNPETTEQLAGLYPELAVFGFGKGCSPALQYKVARIVALSPSIDVARKELRREGIVLDKKTVRRIAEQLGLQLLELRRRELLAWREGWLPAGNDFAGRRVAVQIDGGRVRLRENKKRKKNAKKKKGARQKFDTPWREPKALIIFEFNQHGKMVKKERQPLIDGTLLGPDHLAELAALGLTGDARRKTYVHLRKLLKKSRYDEVVSELKKRAKRKKLKAKHEVWTEIRYLENHGVEGHLRYATFRRRGIPCGSGAIESTIRRVINQRLKSNAMYWLEKNAEAMFAIRALLLCDRWEETLCRVRQTMARDRRIDWQWRAPDLTKLKADESVSPPSPKTPEKQHQPVLAL